MIRNARVVAVLVIGAASLLACADAERLPTVGAIAARGVRLSGVQLVTPAARVTPLAAPVTWSFTVGSGGGASRNEEAGLTIVVPAGAVSQEQTITVTALAGPWVAYRFEPHIDFAESVLLVQDRSGVRGSGLLFGGAHFDGDAPQLSHGKAVVNELASAVTSLLHGTVTIAVKHFSGWLVTSGNESTPKDTSVSQQ